MNNDKSHKLSQPRFENLNGLRFIGALSVFFFHAFTLGNELWGDFFHSTEFQIIAQFMKKGHYGVSLFFVLSGFLITYLLLNEAKQNGKINVFGFFMRRLLRIWPVYFIVILFGFFIFPLLPFGISTTNSLFHYSIFLSNFEEIWNGWRDSVNFLTVTWSVSIEEQYYMGWVLLMLLIPPIRKGKHFPIYFGLLILASIAFRTYYTINYDERVLYYGTLSVVSDLALGGYLSYLCFHKNFVQYLKRLKKVETIFIYFIGIACIIASRKLFTGQLIIIERVFLGLFFAFVIFEQAFSERSFFKADKIKGFFKLGEISYGFYMYHCIVLYFVQMWVTMIGLSDSIIGFILYIAISLSLTISISKMSYKYVEKPLLKLKKHFR